MYTKTQLHAAVAHGLLVSLRHTHLPDISWTCNRQIEGFLRSVMTHLCAQLGVTPSLASPSALYRLWDHEADRWLHRLHFFFSQQSITGGGIFTVHRKTSIWLPSDFHLTLPSNVTTGLWSRRWKVNDILPPCQIFNVSWVTDVWEPRACPTSAKQIVPSAH